MSDFAKIILMKIKFAFFCLLTSFCVFSAYAIPARKGVFTLSQPDGSKFEAVLAGDEFGHIRKTRDGHAIVQDEDGWYCYAFFDEQGRRFSSGVHVGEDAPADVLAASCEIPLTLIRQTAQERRRQIAEIRKNEGEPLLKRIMKANGIIPGTKASGTVKKHAIVLLVEFADVHFQSENNLSAFQNLLTQNGYSKNGATGSALDYFNDQFKGFFEFDFDVAGPLRLPKNRNYYGGNDSEGHDKHPEEMIAQACSLAYNSGVNFSLYDNDNDGIVDNVFVFFAGEDEADYYSDEDCIWSHAWYLYQGAKITARYNGKLIDSYACTSELTWVSETSTVLAGIGTFCHEYSHTFGLPDFYDTDYGGSSATDDDPYINMAAGLWMFTALMDGGNQNNNSNTPPYYNCIEREYLGMSVPEILTAGEHTLEPVHLNGKFYRINTEDPDEYFLLECRSNTGWDKYVNERSQTNYNKGRGLLLYHIDKSNSRNYYSEEFKENTTPYSRWEYDNEVNANPDHQCADLIEADGRAGKLQNMQYFIEQIMDLSGLYYPNGSTTIPNAVLKSWQGKETGFCITDIRMDGDNVLFRACVGANATNMTADIFQTEAIISWGSTSSSGEASVNLSGPGKSWSYKVRPYEDGKYALTVTGLTPATKYTVTVNLLDDQEASSQEMTFTTSAMPKENAYPYIYLATVKKNMNGTFPAGTKLPLKLFNATDAASISWQFDGQEISTGADGYYTLAKSGTLTAIVNYQGGARDIIERVCIIK